LCSGGFPQQILAVIRGLNSHLSVAKYPAGKRDRKFKNIFFFFIKKEKEDRIFKKAFYAGKTLRTKILIKRIIIKLFLSD